ncbi:isoprenylcysteine carboxyl methyltransferase (ICMT) family protein [Saprospira grandis DSM 2844]|uniref:Isoprenylcysteine carboxyl methyltransferase (ICMT) family protein n=1 Tax=Saprospira grandis DSM 2844 TaxID=694433 RepID=J1I802_9BACT|nr:isoprenylcysteine carboxylmethyltransferase family protein [Saprospira grandis]EJF54955.1 isoprenylcysteine carboxyl methyltransferase (ICMT) family protein [Saprospira grandis DSM 2844]
MSLKTELRTEGDFLFKHRSYLPLVIIVLGLAAYIYNVYNKQLIDPNYAEYYKWGCLAVSLIGLFIRMHAIGHAAPNTSGRNTSEGQIADHINSSGWYAICRHPLYVGNFFMWLGLAGLTQDFWFLTAFIFMYWVYYERIMYAEEAFLIDKYGKAYTDWSAKTPAFWPKFSQWRKPDYPFSWAKIIRQEKAGILNLFLVFFIFEAIGSYISSQELLNMSPLWYSLLIGAIVWYVIIKVLQKTTNIFEGR